MNILKTLAVATLSFAAIASAHAAAPTSVSGLLGTWTNANTTTGGIVKIEVTQSGTQLNFKSYGACTPTPCIHSTVIANAFSAGVSSNIAVGFSANRDDGFKTTEYSAIRENSFGGIMLRLNSHSTFAAGDTRKDYVTTELFVKQ